MINKSNKSGLCSYHLAKLHIKKIQDKKKQSRLEFCGRCGAAISGKIRIEIQKNVLYGFCGSCFNKCKLLNIKEIRKLVYKKDTI